jgi:hypothetical protein
MLKALMPLAFSFLLLLSSIFSGCSSASASRQTEISGSENAGTQTAPPEGGESTSGEETAQTESEKPAPEKEEITETEEAKPAEKPKQIPVLTIGEIRRRVKMLIQPPVYQVTVNKLALIRLEDLNLDGTPEILVPCVKIEGDEEQDIDTDRFSNFSSLFGQEDLSFPFYLYLFRMEEKGPVLAKDIPLGSRAVYGGMAKVPIIRGSSVPFVIIVKFQTQEGVEQEWLVFNGKSILPISRLSLNETFSSKLLIEDIDRNGSIDVVVQEKGSEEGIGLETFLTWYRWNGWQFSEYATANIVRSLKAFLSSTKQFFLDKDWRSLLSHAFLPEEVQRYQGRGMSAAQIILRGFGLADYYDTKERSADEILREIQEFVFPEFLENPFITRDDRGSFFRMTFRILDSQGISIVSEVPLYMQRNPFLKRQFFFRIQ